MEITWHCVTIIVHILFFLPHTKNIMIMFFFFFFNDRNQIQRRTFWERSRMQPARKILYPVLLKVRRRHHRDTTASHITGRAEHISFLKCIKIILSIAYTVNFLSLKYSSVTNNNMNLMTRKVNAAQQDFWPKLDVVW